MVDDPRQNKKTAQIEIKAIAPEVEKLRKQDLKKNGIYLFLSFDLVNATEYKTRNYNNWFSTFINFYKEMTKRLNDSNSPIRNAKIWKYLGDEVLFYLKITNKKEIFLCLPFLLETITAVQKFLNQEESMYFDKIYVKTTIWIADVIDEKIIKTSEIENKINNIIFCPNSSSQKHEIDFLGSDIDLGFRISKFSHQNVLTLDAKLTYLLLHHKKTIKKEIEDCLKIVDYQMLKGVWRNHKYPIIWYCQKWEKDIFRYDEQHDKLYKPYIKKIMEKQSENKKMQNLSDTLNKIFDDINQKKSIEFLCEEVGKLDMNRDLDEPRLS